MPEQGVSFAGAYIALPGAYYQDNVSAVPPPPPVTPPLLFLAYAWGPKPKTPVTYSSQNLAAAMRGSPGATFVPFIITPSPALNGAQQITLIDVSNNTQSSAALTASGGQTQTLLTSVLYGPPSNQLTYQLTGGSTAGRKLVITDNYAGGQYVGDNLTVPFTLAYSGAATGGVSYSVASSAFVASSPVSGESVVIPLGSGAYATVSSLVNYLNGTANWYASVLSGTNGQLPSNFLTAVTGVSVTLPSGGALQPVNVNAYLQDIAFWVNQFAGSMASASVSGAASDTAAWLPVTGNAVFFSGATGVPPTNQDYATALNIGLSSPAWTVFCDSNATAVQALLTQHCITASSVPYGSWRRGFTGSSIGDTVSTTKLNSRALDAIQIAYLYPGIYQTNPVTGQNQLYSGLYAAAAAAGMATGNQVALPLTNKPLLATGVEAANAGQPLTTSQLIDLQNNGVMCVFAPQQTGVPTILSDITTWEADNNPENTSSQQVACRYWLAYTMVNALRPYVGQIASPVTEVATLNAAIRALNALVFTSPSSNGVLASWQQNSLVLIYTGSNMVAGVQFNCQFVGQNRYITVYASIQPLNFTITSTG